MRTFGATNGSVNTNGKLTIDNTAQILGQAFNQQVYNVVVTGMGVGYTSAPTVTIAAPTGTGATATATANFDALTGTVRSITITNPGSGYVANPVVTFTGGGFTTVATAIAVVNTVSAGTTTSLMQKAGVASITGGITIKSDQAVGNVFPATFGLGYTSAPSVGFALPFGYQNLVTAGGSGYTTAPTVTVSGGTSLTGKTDPAFTVIVAQGKVVSVIGTSGGTLWLTPPTLTLTGGGGSGATCAYPANCLATATAAITQDKVSNFTITNAGFGYTAAPTVSLVGGGFTTAATATSRVGLYNITLSFFTTSPSNQAHSDAGIMPTNRRINLLTATNMVTGSAFSGGDIDVYGSTALTFTTSLLNMASGTLKCTHPSYAGFTGSTTNSISGNILLSTPGGSLTRTFPYDASVVVATGTGSLATGSTITTLTASRTAAPSGSVLPASPPANPIGPRAYRLQTNSGAIYGTQPTVTLNQNATDALSTLADNPTLFIAQSAALAGTWTIRSTTSGTGSLTVPGSRTTGTTAPTLIVPLGDDYFAWVSTLVVCSGTPTPGTVPTSSTFCTGTAPSSITATGFTSGVGGITLQWEQSLDNGGIDPWISAVGGTGATTATYTPPTNLATTIYYRLKVTCSNSALFATSNACQMIPTACTFDVAYTQNASFTSIVPLNGGTGLAFPGWQSATSGDDNTTTTQTLAGTTFKYQGVTVTGMQACSNGWMTFNTANTSVQWTNALGSASQTKLLAPFWDDLVFTGQAYANRDACVRYQISGTLGSGSAIITVEWAGLERFNIPGPNLNFQVKLFESDNHIEYIYGNFEGFDGTLGTSGYSYSIGYNGTSPSGTTAADRFAMQTAVTNHFSAVSDPAAHIRMPKCFSKFTFTPGVYTGPTTAPAIPVPANDERGGAIDLTVNTSPCTTYCGTYYTSEAATNSGAGQACATTAGNQDDDVWFKFTTTAATDYRISLKASPNYDGVLELIAPDGSTSIACANATGAGLTENINATGLIAGGTTYYARVFHNGTTIGTSSGEFSICVNQIVLPPANDDSTGAVLLTVNSTCSNTAAPFPSTTAATASPNPACTGTPDDDIWYQFVASSANDIVTVTPVGAYNAVLQVYSSSNNAANGTFTSLGCVNNNSTGGVEVFNGVGLVPGNTYFIRVYHFASGSGSGQFNICVTLPPAPGCTTNTTPANNAINVSATPTLTWAAATYASSYDVYLGTTAASATLQGNVTTTSYVVPTALAFSTQYFWYVVPKNVTGSATGCVANSTSFTTDAPCPTVTGIAVGSITATDASVSWTGTGNFIVEIGAVGFTPGTNAVAGVGGTIYTTTTSPQVVTGLSGCTPYDVYIRRDCTGAGNGYGLNSALVQFTSGGTCTAPANDNVCNAITLTVDGASDCQNTTGATTEAVETPLTTCSTPNNTVWYKFTPTTTGAVQIVMTSPTVSVVTGGFWLSLFTLTGCPTPTLTTAVSCTGNSLTIGTTPGQKDSLSMNVIAGTEYYLQIDGVSGAYGAFCIKIKSPSVAPGTANACATGTSVTIDATNNSQPVALLGAKGNIIGEINANGNNLGLTTVSFYKNTNAVRNLGTGYYLDRNISITPTTQPSSPVTVKLYFTAAEYAALQSVDPSVVSPATLNINKTAQVCGPTYTGPGTFLSQNTSGSYGSDYSITFQTPSFSSFFIKGGAGVLPVTIEFFKGTKQGTNNVLDWKVNCTTAPSVQLSLERSADGRRFASIDDQTATATRCLQGFNYTDNKPLAGFNYYRLKTTSPDGKIAYSTIVVLLNKEKGFELISLAPNPVKNTSILSLTTVKGGKIDISVSDVAGKVISNQSVIVIAGNNPIVMNFASLGAGTYIITAVNAEGELKTTRFVKY